MQATTGRAEAEGVKAHSVSAVNAMVKNLLESRVPALWIEGEIANWKRHSSGHCYFSLRDKDAQIRCVLWRAAANRLPTLPEDGMQVRVLGKITLYEQRGEFQVNVTNVEAVGAGGLWQIAFDKLKKKLDAEGLLAPARKRALPRFPHTIGIVTSPVGAALQDVLHVLRRRSPWLRVFVAPARVQGDGVEHEIAAALRRVAQEQPDTILLVRGGGSIEDLWAFNTEVVARAIAASDVPVITGVGHETDITIADLVSDCRAPTPSAAAELCAPDGADLGRYLAAQPDRLSLALRARVRRLRERLERNVERLPHAMQNRLRMSRERLRRLASTLNALSPLAVLERGYAVAMSEDGHLLRRGSEFQADKRIVVRVSDARVHCRVDQVEPLTTDEA